ncbi:hypothetical protein G7009_16475 [Pseudomonas capeferrum]|uniref:hypothetical protein n=1 Tax=Pseudomonas capeferrum TaxID=1495066 RepID=UPI0015E28610|nr:hypothetical protein [Pseudomonas capeferrum]MBA1203324.1 hypothetical protein [Pseudomonas capeferrum]
MMTPGTDVLLRKGPAMVAMLTRYTSPAVLIIAAVLLYLVTRETSFSALWHPNVDAKLAYTTDPLLQLVYGVEFGASNALTIVPFFGGIAWLIRKCKHLITPCLLDAGIVGVGFTTAVGAPAAVATGCIVAYYAAMRLVIATSEKGGIATLPSGGRRR